MQLFVKLYGYKQFAGKKLVPIDAEPSDTVSAIASKIHSITGIPPEMLTFTTGLSVCNPSRGFKTLELSRTLADYDLGDQYALLLVSVSGPHSTKAPPSNSQFKRRLVCLAIAHYWPSPTEPMRTADVVAVAGAGSTCRTALQYEGVEYANALEWLAKAFNNSGKSCYVPVERSHDVGTPRPKRYVPPSAACPFGGYC